MEKPKFIIIETTSNKKKILNQISNKLINNKLSPCVHIQKILNSKYMWKNKIVSHKEYKLSIKTLSKNEKRIYSIIKEMHNHKVPYISKKPLQILNEDYKKWFLKATDKP